jgi:hypothetical protein
MTEAGVESADSVTEISALLFDHRPVMFSRKLNSWYRPLICSFPEEFLFILKLKLVQIFYFEVNLFFYHKGFYMNL